MATNTTIVNRPRQIRALFVGGLIAGPLTNYSIAALRAGLGFVSTAEITRYATMTLGIGLFAGVIAGIVCAGSHADVQRTTTRTVKVMLPIWAFLYFPFVPLFMGKHSLGEFIGFLGQVLSMEIGAGLTGALTALLVLAWERAEPEPTPTRPRPQPERYQL